VTSIDHPGLIPGVLLGGDGEHTVRDRAVDVLVVLLSLGGGLLLLGTVDDRQADPVQLVEVVSGGALSLALWWRRRALLPIVLVATALSAVLVTAGAPAAIGLFLVAVHQRLVVALWVAALGAVAGVVQWAIYPTDGFAVVLAFIVVAGAGVVAWGAFVRARRQLVASLRERVDQAEAEQRLLAERARQAERSRIAREMHDVVAHRVSLVALHAGGLQVRPDLNPDGVRETAGLIRAAAQDALDELRGVIGILRESGAGLDQPLPTLVDVPGLVEQSRQAGARIALDLAVTGEPPRALGRDCFRIVQEALTNAHKHAPGTAVQITVSGSAGDGVRVEVRNRRPVRTPVAALQGSGTGLVGLAERVALAGGEFSHGVERDEFVVRAELPWGTS
jgi:signal transduction histidine kinase